MVVGTPGSSVSWDQRWCRLGETSVAKAADVHSGEACWASAFLFSRRWNSSGGDLPGTQTLLT